MYLGVSCHSVARFLRALEQNPVSLQNHRTFRKINQESQKYNNYLIKMLLIISWLLNCCVWSGAKMCKSCKNIWNPLLSSRGPPRTLLRDTNPKIQFPNWTIYHFIKDKLPAFAFFFCLCVTSTIQRKSTKIGPRWLGRLPSVDRTLAQSRPKVDPRGWPNVKRK